MPPFPFVVFVFPFVLPPQLLIGSNPIVPPLFDVRTRRNTYFPNTRHGNTGVGNSTFVFW